MMPNEKNTKRVILALDQAYEKFIQLEDKSTDEAEIVSYRCLYTNIYESKLYVEQMQKEIDRLKAEQPKVIRCKDCKFAYRKETDLSNSYKCRYPFLITKESHYGDFFCAFAEPKDGEQV